MCVYIYIYKASSDQFDMLVSSWEDSKKDIQRIIVEGQAIIDGEPEIHKPLAESIAQIQERVSYFEQVHTFSICHIIVCSFFLFFFFAIHYLFKTSFVGLNSFFFYSY